MRGGFDTGVTGSGGGTEAAAAVLPRAGLANAGAEAVLLGDGGPAQVIVVAAGSVAVGCPAAADAAAAANTTAAVVAPSRVCIPGASGTCARRHTFTNAE